MAECRGDARESREAGRGDAREPKMAECRGDAREPKMAEQRPRKGVKRSWQGRRKGAEDG
jgi:hypothetical protein